MNRISYQRGAGSRPTNIASASQVTARQPMQQDTPVQSAQMLMPSVSINTQPINALGNVAFLPVQDNGLPFVSFTLDNSATSATTLYVIGDPDGVVAAASKLTLAQPDDCSLGVAGVAATQASFKNAPIAINLINYSATSGAAQFGQSFRYAKGDVSGEITLKPMPIALARRNDQFNANLLTLGGVGSELKWNTALIIAVAGNQVVQLDIQPMASANR